MTVGRDEKELVEKHLELVRKYKRVFGSKDGKEVLDDIIRNTSFLEVHTENLELHAGMRMACKQILEMVEADYEAIRGEYTDMLKDNLKGRINDVQMDDYI